MRTLKPLDMGTIGDSVRKTHRLVIVNEGAHTGGFAAEVMARAYEEVFDYLDAPIVRVTSEDVPIPYNEKLELAALPSEQKIIDAVHGLL
jgi:pyruvate dehydrogenase E1 component beta subunit